MRGFFAVVRREIEEKRFVFTAAAIASLLPFFAPLIPGVELFPTDETRGVAVLFLALAFLVVLSLLLGATTINRDLAEQRIAFYFSRPITALSILCGKIFSSALIVVSCALVIAIPTLASNAWVRRVFRSENSVLRVGDIPPLEMRLTLGRSVALVGLVVLALVLLAHCLGLIFRSRSAWLLFDAVGASLTIVAVLAAVAQITLLPFVDKSRRSWILILAALLLASTPIWLVASAVQTTTGRIDLRRGHKLLSVTLWSCLIAATAGLLAFSVWYANPTPHEIVGIWSIVPAPSGDWIAISGSARHRPYLSPAFIYNTATGSHVRLRTPLWYESEARVAFAQDGTAAAWLEGNRSGDGPRYQIVTAQLGTEVHKGSELVLNEWPEFFLSPDGSRLASVTGNLLSVFELPALRLIVSTRLPQGGCDPLKGVFAGRDKIRVVCWRFSVDQPMTLTINELDIPTRTLIQTGTIPPTGAPVVVLSPLGDRLVVEERTSQRLTVRDGRSGAVLAVCLFANSTANEGSRDFDSRWFSKVQIAFLGEGRMLISDTLGGVAHVRVLSPEGNIEVARDLGRATRILVGGQQSQDEVLLGLCGKDPAAEPVRLLSLTLANGYVREVSGSLLPVAFREPVAWNVGSAASKTFFEPRSQTLVHFDRLTGTRRVILPGHSR